MWNRSSVLEIQSRADECPEVGVARAIYILLSPRESQETWEGYGPGRGSINVAFTLTKASREELKRVHMIIQNQVKLELKLMSRKCVKITLS